MDIVPIHTPADLYQCWRALMGPLGFSRRSLWLGFVTDDGQLVPSLHQIDEIPERVDIETCLPLLEMCGLALREIGSDSAVAMLLTRPGRDPMNPDDRSWARALVAAAVTLGIPMHPVHFANDESLLVFAADDLLPIT